MIANKESSDDQEFFADKPGFEPFRVGLNSERIFQDAVRIKLTQSLGKIELYTARHQLVNQ